MANVSKLTKQEHTKLLRHLDVYGNTSIMAKETGIDSSTLRRIKYINRGLDEKIIKIRTYLQSI